MSVRPGWRHPVVRRHPETAELCLYVNPSYVVPDSLQHEDGSCVADSAKLLESVYAACLGSDAQSQPVHLRLCWDPGMFVIWDNISIMHRATTLDMDPDQPQRAMFRMSLK